MLAVTVSAFSVIVRRTHMLFVACMFIVADPHSARNDVRLTWCYIVVCRGGVPTSAFMESTSMNLEDFGILIFVWRSTLETRVRAGDRSCVEFGINVESPT